jgi:ATP-dependent DNA helicase RecG
VRVAGRLEKWQGRWQMAHPDPVADGPLRPEPIYPLTGGLTQRRIAGLVGKALERLPDLPEWIEPGLLARQRWAGFAAALAHAHQDPDDVRARDRLAHDELLAGQLAWLLVRARRRRQRGVALTASGRLAEQLRKALPWPLTAAQDRVLREIAGDLVQPHAMLRLLQGDVGSGKTLVAVLAMLHAIESGAQACLLAPTELLARQHHATLERMLAGLPVRLGFLSGRDRARGRAQTLAALADGRIDLVVGTHALLSAGVAFPRLGLAVVDEQHRFGVAQRMLLAERSASPPHMLVMTATPIPRTLQLARYGEMDVSRLDERPPGRQPIDTRIVALARIDEVIEGLARHLASDARAYWVCPLLEAGSDADLAEGEAAPAVARAAMLRARFGEDAVALVHGRMPGPERDRAMARFASGEARLLVATTVIEVGVDVPEATLMVVEAAERFGLAQLHQLRGRVGRGTGRSTCLLLRGDPLSETARARLRMMRETEDGFAIAEADLKLRGAGELLGTRQSGQAAYRLAGPDRVDRMIATARDDARLLLERDGGLQGPRGTAARHLLYLFEQDAAVATLKGG